MPDIRVQAAEYLPEDIEIRILSLCPVKSLLRFRCVSKRWLSLISDPDFIQLHLTQSNREHILIAPDVIMEHPATSSMPCDYSFLYYAGSCNGLVCFSMNNQELVVFNPSTRVYKELPLPPETDLERYEFYWGFGYDSSIDDYKLVLSMERPCDSSKIMVLSFKDNFWRNTHKFDGDNFISFSHSRSYAVFLNGSLHWIGVHVKKGFVIFILSFDLSKEVFEEIPGPDKFPDPTGRVPEGYRYDYIGVVGGCLCVTQVDWNGVGFVMNMWAMKEYNVKSSWVKLFEVPSISPDRDMSPLFFLRNGEILVMWAGWDLVAYYPLDDRQQKIEICDRFKDDEVAVALYTESLISPICGKDWRGDQLFMDFMAKKVAVMDVGSPKL